MTSNPVLPGDMAWTTSPSIPPSELPWPSSWQTPAGMGVVDRKLVQGQGPSSLITPMQLQRQKLRAFDISFILFFCSFVLLSLCRRAAGVSIITYCFPELYPMHWKVSGYIQPVKYFTVFGGETGNEWNLSELINSFPSHMVRTQYCGSVQ